MEQKLVKVPFEIELAKRIQSGECEGKIVTRDGKKARVVCWDTDGRNDYILALLSNENREYPVNFMPNGLMVKDEKTQSDLMIEIPEYMTFKDGDVLISSIGNPFIFNGRISKYGSFGSYCGINSDGDLILDSNEWTMKVNGYANEKQKNILIGHLKRDWRNTAKEYLERFFGIEEKEEYEFKPFDKVLVRDDIKDSKWSCDLFSHKNEDGLYVCIGRIWEKCIPYEGNEHLLGTTNELEEK